MKSYTEYLTFETKKRREMVHITDQVETIVKRSGIKDGLCFVSPMHITAAVYVDDNESGLIEDIGKWLEELAPARPDYRHHQTGKDNGDAHLKSLLLHHETTLPVTNGALDLGTWQRVFYAEFDGKHPKRIIVKVLGVAVLFLLIGCKPEPHTQTSRSVSRTDRFRQPIFARWLARSQSRFACSRRARRCVLSVSLVKAVRAAVHSSFPKAPRLD